MAAHALKFLSLNYNTHLEKGVEHGIQLNMF